MLSLRTALVPCTLLFATAIAHAGDQDDDDPAQACWRRTAVLYVPFAHNPPAYNCYTTIHASQSQASAQADGHTSSGNGWAWDQDIFCEAKVQTAVATGIYSETWRDPCNKGDVEFSGFAQVQGQANLIDADCAAAALGYQQITSNVCDTIAAVLNDSAGETSKGAIGDLTVSIEGVEIEIPINVSQGEGVYNDNDMDSDAAYECTNFFTFEKKSRAYIKVWANMGWFTIPLAHCTANMSGNASVSYVLGTCPG